MRSEKLGSGTSETGSGSAAAPAALPAVPGDVPYAAKALEAAIRCLNQFRTASLLCVLCTYVLTSGCAAWLLGQRLAGGVPGAAAA